MGRAGTIRARGGIVGLKREEERDGEGLECLEYENKMYCNKEIERHPPPTPKR